ncbi:MAG: hypothetical protein IT548_18080 [Alphaproteobacteria bacterium]|nr:hypothetical protein [Alphaproteobacteria bacterium]
MAESFADLLEGVDEACRPPERAWSIHFKMEQDFNPDALNTIARSITVIALHLLKDGFDLSRLDGIIIAEDYPKALRELDRGFQPSRALTHTQTSFGSGVAMAVPVIRDDKYMAHIVFDVRGVVMFIAESQSEQAISRYLVAHEMGHVHDLAMQCTGMPSLMPTDPIEGELEGYLISVARACWDEYIACIVSAPYNPAEVESRERVLVDCVAGLQKDINLTKIDFVKTGDVGTAWPSCAILAGDALKFAAYLIGHLEGANQKLEEHAPEAASVIRGSFFERHFSALEEALRTMMQSYGKWGDFSSFQPVKDVALAFLRSLGVRPRPMADGSLWVDIDYPADLTALDVLRLRMQGAWEANSRA